MNVSAEQNMLNVSEEKKMLIKRFINSTLIQYDEVVFAIHELDHKLDEFENIVNEEAPNENVQQTVEDVKAQTISVIKDTNKMCSISSESSSDGLKNIPAPQPHHHNQPQAGVGLAMSPMPRSSIFSKDSGFTSPSAQFELSGSPQQAKTPDGLSQVLSNSGGTIPGSISAGSLVPGIQEYVSLTDHSINSVYEKERQRSVLQPYPFKSPIDGTIQEKDPEFSDPLRSKEHQAEPKGHEMSTSNAEKEHESVVTDDLNEASEPNNGQIKIPIVFNCLECNKTFKTSSNLETHKKRHANSFILACRICKKVFKNRQMRDRHENVHSDVKENRYACDSCDKSFTRKDHLKRHKNTMHGIAKFFECNFCSKNFKKKSRCKTHMQSCEKKNSLGIKIANQCNCSVCGKGFNNEILLKRHKLTHDKSSRPYSCSRCGRKYAYKHRKNNHEITCNIQGETSDEQPKQQQVVYEPKKLVVNDQVQHLVNDQLQHVVNDQLQHVVNGQLQQFAVNDQVQQVAVKDQVQHLVNDQLQHVVNDQLQDVMNDQLQHVVNGQLQQKAVNYQLVDKLELVDRQQLVCEQADQQGVFNEQELVDRHHSVDEHQRVIQLQTFDESVCAQLPVTNEVIQHCDNGSQDFNYNIVSAQYLNLGFYDEDTGLCYKFINN